MKAAAMVPRQDWPRRLRQGRVLFVRLDNLGDVLMSTPAMQAVRHALPRAHLALLASPSGAAAAPYLRMLDETIAYDAPWVKGSGEDPGVDADRALLERLRQAAFDAAIVFTVASQSALPAALLCRVAGVPLRLAVSRENPYDLLTHWVHETDVVAPGMRHEVRRQLDLVAAVGFAAGDSRLAFTLRDEDRRGARDRLRRSGVDPDAPFVLFHPGASAPSRRYPPQAYGEAAALLAREGWTCVFAGGPGEREAVAQARAAMAAHRGHAGHALGDEPLPLGELGALIEAAAVLVANNSAPAHLAAALGTPVVDLYALTNPQHTPWQVEARVLSHEVPCRDCLRSVCPMGHHDCLRQVPPRAVADAALQLLTSRQPALLQESIPT